MSSMSVPASRGVVEPQRPRPGWARAHRDRDPGPDGYPLELRAEYGGRVQEFDTMIYPQYLSAPEVVGLAENMPPYYHFRHVISSWRDLKNGHPTPLNGGLKLFLIRTLVDVFDHSGWDYDPLPEHKAFVDGTVDYSRMMSDEEADEMVRFFFAEFDGLIDAHIFDEAQNRELRRRVSELRAVLCEL